jgi:hypothetical protein
MFPRENRVSVRAGVTQLVECDLAKVDVAGSNPVSRSRNLPSWIAMKTSFLLFLLAFSLVFSVSAQGYKVEPLTSAAPGLPAAYASVVESQGYRVSGPSGVWCEVWIAKSVPSGGKPSDAAITFGIPQGAFVGILRFPGKGADRRGQVIPAGVYTMRYSDFPADGAHQGAAPQRDFALLTPIAADADPAAKPDFATLVQWSIKASGTNHPAVMGMESPPSGAAMGSVTKEGENDWTLTVKSGDVTFSIILVGKAEA